MKQYGNKSAGFRALTLHGRATGRLADQAYAFSKNGDVVVIDVKAALRGAVRNVEISSDKILRVVKRRNHLLEKRQSAEHVANTHAALSADPRVTVLRGDAFDAVLNQLERPAETSEASRMQVARHRLRRRQTLPHLPFQNA
jgi:hypothetical protein